MTFIKRGYWGTFFSVLTGREYVQRKFLGREGDENKAKIFKYNRNMWRGIRGEVREWCLEGWEGWQEEQPAWFTDGWKGAVDDDMIPEESLESARSSLASGRRSSLGNILGMQGGGPGLVHPAPSKE